MSYPVLYPCYLAGCIFLCHLPMSNSSVHGAGCFSIKEFIGGTYKLLCFYSRSANVNTMNKNGLIGHVVDFLKTWNNIVCIWKNQHWMLQMSLEFLSGRVLNLVIILDFSKHPIFCILLILWIWRISFQLTESQFYSYELMPALGAITFKFWQCSTNLYGRDLIDNFNH